MDTTTTGWGTLGATLSGLLDSLLTHAPALLLAILVLVAGWLVARLLRHAARHAADGANRVLDRFFRRGLLSGARLSPAMIAVIGEIAFWVVLLFAVVVAANLAGLTTLTSWLGRLIAHLPNLLAGIVIIVVGHFLGLFVREKTVLATERSAAAHGALMGRLAQAAVLAVALIIGLDQIGVDVAIVVVLAAVTVGGVVIGLSGAYALGARRFVGNLIGARSARHALGAGLRVRIGDVEGIVLEITATHIALDTAAGKLLVPARVIDEQQILIITDTAEEEDASGQ